MQNRTTNDTGVRLDGNLLDIQPIAGTGITPAQAVAATSPLLQFLDQIPYVLDAQGEIDYRTNTHALSHEPELTFAPGHPDAGQPILADYTGGAFVTRFGGVPMPFNDFDKIDPFALKIWLQALYDIRDAMLNAT